MAEVERVIDAPVERVWAVLASGWSYSDWVVGSAHVRKVGEHWPQVGTAIHHTSGLWPLTLSDVTVVKQVEPPYLLVTEPRLRPLGRGIVTLRLAEAGPERTRVTLGETFQRGLMGLAMVKLNDLILHRRNVEALRRLADLAVHDWPRIAQSSNPAARGRSDTTAR